MFHSAALKLTAWYLAIIMLLSVGCSVALYNTSSADLERNVHRQLPFSVNQLLSPDDLQSLQALRAHQLEIDEGNLRSALVFFNVMVLIFGGLASYGLARRTLRPLEESLEAQKRFTSDASHELRTPLTAIQAENEVALRDPKLTRAEAVALLQSNLEEVGKLKALSEGLLHLAQAGKNQPGFNVPIDIQPSITEALERLEKAAQAKNITIKNQTKSLMVKAEHRSLTELLVILIDNAIKYSPRRYTITITSSTRGKTSQISVADRGVGIAAADLPHIFDRFFRAESSRSKTQTSGYGLGLAIAKKLADSMDGYITVKSAPGKGSTFTISLPNA